MSMELKYYESQSFRNEPDCYDGDSCDLLRPRWMTSYPKEGDVEEDSDILKLKLDARRMPPGTRITIEIPCCPECGESADSVEPKKRVREWPDCRCGFSWSKWATEEYS